MTRSTRLVSLLLALATACQGGDSRSGAPGAGAGPVAPGARRAVTPMQVVAQALPATAPVAAPWSLTASDGSGLAVARVEARAVVEGPLAFTELHLWFDNAEDRTREGRFAITLPPGAAVSRFAMESGGQWQEAEVVEKGKARRVYEDFLHRKQDPALLEKGAGNQFTARVFPIAPRARKHLIVSYSQELAGRGYTLPLRGLPQIGTLAVELRARQLDGTYATQRLAQQGWRPDHDFLATVVPLATAVMAGDLVVAAIPFTDPKANEWCGFGAAQPPGALTVLVDTSASRALGFASYVAQVRALIDGLRTSYGDLPVRVVAFDQDTEVIFEGKASGYGAAHDEALRARGAAGASDLGQALATLAAAPHPEDARLVVITDGVVTAGPAGPALIASLAKLPTQRLDVVLAGGIRDEAFATQLAQGTLPQAGEVFDLDEGVAPIAQGLGDPVLVGAAVDVPGATWVYPRTLPPTRPGRTRLVFARMAKPGQVIEVVVGKHHLQLGLGSAAQPLLERAVASAEIEELEAELALATGDEAARLREVIARYSVKARVISSQASMLVLESDADYERFHIPRTALADILVIGPRGVERQGRAPAVLAHNPPAAPPKLARPDPWASTRERAIEVARSAGVLGSSGVAPGARPTVARSGWNADAPTDPAVPPPEEEERGAVMHDGDNESGGTGTAMALEEGTMGRRDSDRAEGQYRMQGSAPPPSTGDVFAGQDERDVMGGLTGNGEPPRAAPAVEPAPAAGSASAGFDDANAYGSLLGTEVGTGPGGGGLGVGTVGTGRYGTIGHGAGTGAGYGVGGGRGGMRGRSASTPSLRLGTLAAQGTLDRLIIRRYIKRNAQRLQYCYERELLRTPGLGGTLQASFAITPDGHVSGAVAAGVNPEVERCVAGVLFAIQFPAPPSGAVMVRLPLAFAPTDSSAPIPPAPRSPGFVDNAPSGTGTGTPPLPEAQRTIPALNGRLAEVMAALAAKRTPEALAIARRWHDDEPGEVLALIALGEALEATQDIRGAARIYGSIIDLFPSRADLRRFAGERLERLGAPARALVVDTYRRAVADRPDHVTGHRLLAYALSRAGDHQGAFDAIVAGLAREYPGGRFAGAERVLKEDLGLLAAVLLANGGDRKVITAELATRGATLPAGPSTRFVLYWETDANDVDFHIHDARGGHAWYSNMKLASGGELYADVTTGFGPECFTIPGTPAAGPYRLSINYFSQGPMGYGMGLLQVQRFDGKRLTFEDRPYVIMNDHAFVDLGTAR